jgi:hypothetical protein
MLTSDDFWTGKEDLLDEKGGFAAKNLADLVHPA